MHTPNHIPKSTRLWCIGLSLFLLAYGTYSVYVDDIYVPGRPNNTGAHFHGETVWIIYISMVCASLSLLSVVVDHYDVRNNETNYRRFATVTQWAAWAFFILAIFLDLVVFQTREYK